MKNILTSSKIKTPLGNMMAISDAEALYLLAFEDQKGLEKEISNLSQITYGITKPIKSIKSELECYFNGELQTFKTPIILFGTDFQKKCWHELQNAPYGKTKSYSSQAYSIGNPNAYRAVANANSKNKLAIIIPCHRIINNNDNLGGYAGGIERKKWLISHEKKFLKII